ncbi:MAG: hypothetical protein H6742_03675 [Alphaproteobacteria bacterium]|nr:hypothetical protein [Alphaproteobacteria bacterium]
MSLVLALLMACSADPTATDSGGAVADDALDLRLTEADLPALSADEQIWWGPEVVIPAATEIQYCLIQTYTGPDVGLHNMATHQNQFGHHFVPMGTSASPIDFPDGTVVDCTDGDTLGMGDLQPFMLPNEGTVGGEVMDTTLFLPDDMAVKLDEGQRYVIQAHYINTGDQDIRVQDAAVLQTVPEDSVGRWAAPFILAANDFSLPAGIATDQSTTCTVDDELQLLYVLGHMHEHGSAFRLTHSRGSDSAVIYDVPAWDPEFRDTPPVEQFGADTPFVLLPGDEIQMDCAWQNTTEHTIDFPSEMCVAVGVAFEKKTTTFCEMN